MLAAIATTAQGKISLDLVSRHRALWRAIDPAARERAARTPILLFDLHFQDERWWQLAIHGPPSAMKTARSPEGLPVKHAAALVRETLMLAVPTAREDLHAAILLFGMSSAVADLYCAAD